MKEHDCTTRKKKGRQTQHAAEENEVLFGSGERNKIKILLR